MDTKTWEMLYGSLVIDITSPSPNIIRLTLDVGDMRHLLKPQGQYVYITLHNCTQFEYVDMSYSDEITESTLTNLADIAERKPQLAHASVKNAGNHVNATSRKRTKNDVLHIQCKYGELTLRYASASIGVDHIKPVSEKVLVAVSQKYWRAGSAVTAQAV